MKIESPVAIADPNAPLEEWVKRCPRELLERMYIFAINQASEATKAKDAALEQLRNERELPSRYREGVWKVRYIDGERQAHYVESIHQVRRMLLFFDQSQDEIKEFLEHILS